MRDVHSLEQRFTKVLQDNIQQWPIDPDDQDEASRRVAALGGVQVVKAAIREPGHPTESLSLWASDRPDLTFEALALCPAWSDLFSKEEKAVARARLEERKSENRPERRSKTRSDTWIFWVDGRPMGAVPDSASASPCETLGRAARTFAESGRFWAGFSQRRHFRTCAACAALSQLEDIVSQFDQEEFRRLRVLLRTLATCLQNRQGWARGWRAMLLCSYIDAYCHEYCQIGPRDWIHARQGLADQSFSKFVQELDEAQFFGFLVAVRVSEVFDFPLPMEGEIALPTDGDITSEPGVLNAVSTSVESEWSDLMGPTLDVAGLDVFDYCGFVSLAEMAVWHEDDIQSLLKGPGPKQFQSAIRKPGAEHDAFNNDAVDASSLDRAESSLRAALGEELCDNLTAESLYNAVEAERCCLDHDDGRMGNAITLHLAMAFELQLRHVVIRPFLENLRRRGVRDFSGPKGYLLRKADDLILSDIGKLLRNPASELADFIESLSLDVSALRAGIDDVVPLRNRACHCVYQTHRYGCEIRDRWLGIERGDGGIFGLLRPIPSG